MEDLLEESTTSYETFEQKRSRLQVEALGNYAFLSKNIESRGPVETRGVTLNRLHEAAHATPWLVLLSTPDDDHADIRRLRNILVHSTEPSTIVLVDAFRNHVERLVELFKSFHAASALSVESSDFPGLWTESNEAATYQAITRWLDERIQSDDEQWNDAKNERRCDLVDKEIDGTLTDSERLELEQLQQEMLAYRRKVAPRPLEEVRRVHRELLRKAAEEED